jgi:hypothetical protein
LRIEVADPQHSLVLYGSPADMGAEDSWERSIWQFVVPGGSMVGASCCSGTATPMARTGRADSFSDRFPLEVVSLVMSRKMMLNINRLADRET